MPKALNANISTLRDTNLNASGGSATMALKVAEEVGYVEIWDLQSSAVLADHAKKEQGEYFKQILPY